MVELFEEDLKEDGRKSSKGNQLKWKKDGIWYKSDYTGYEGLAEYLISHNIAVLTDSNGRFDYCRIFYQMRKYEYLF